jgi:hypothetical protein
LIIFLHIELWGEMSIEHIAFVGIRGDRSGKADIAGAGFVVTLAVSRQRAGHLKTNLELELRQVEKFANSGMQRAHWFSPPSLPLHECP